MQCLLKRRDKEDEGPVGAGRCGHCTRLPGKHPNELCARPFLQAVKEAAPSKMGSLLGEAG